MVGPVRNSPRTATRAAIQRIPSDMSTLLVQPPPRPPNAWIIFRSEYMEQHKGRQQADISKIVSRLWNNADEATRLKYERLADEAKAEHALKYPNYRFTPMRKEQKQELKAAQKALKKLEKERIKQANKDAKKRGRARPVTQDLPPPATSNTPSPHTVAFAPLPQHNLFPPMLNGVYYPPGMFGTAGPSPPLSLASSPAASIASPVNASDDNNDASATVPQPQTPAAPTTYPTNPSGNPYLTYFGGRSNQLLYTPPDLLAAPMPQPQSGVEFSVDSLPVPTEDVPQPPQTNEQTQSAGGLRLPSPSPPAQELFYSDNSFPDMFAQDNSMLQFNVDENLLNLGGQDGGGLLDFPNNIFSLDNFAPGNLDLQPTGELVVDFNTFSGPNSNANFDFEQFLNNCLVNNLDEPNFLQQLDPSLGTLPMAQPLPDFPVEQTFQEVSNTEPVAEPAAPTPAPPTAPSTSSLQGALSTDLINTDNSQRTSSYVPPSGAAMSSTRRVGGRWKPPPAVVQAEGTLDLSSPQALA